MTVFRLLRDDDIFPLQWWYNWYITHNQHSFEENIPITSKTFTTNIKDIKESERLYTEAYGGVATGEFVNSCVRLKTIYTPHELLSKNGEIEKAGDRVRTVHWGDRTLDVDIIFFGDQVIGDDDLAVPHPDMQNREFVLKPLFELCPNKVHPLFKKRVSELYFALTTKQL